RDLSIDIDQTSYKDIGMLSEEVPFKFNVTINDRDDLLLNILPSNEGIYLKAYQLFFLEGICYFLSERQAKIVEQVSHMRGFGPLPVEKNSVNMFISEILPQFEKVGQVHLSEDVKTQL